MRDERGDADDKDKILDSDIAVMLSRFKGLRAVGKLLDALVD